MLTEDAQVHSFSTRQLWAPSVNISVEYLELPDHDSMNNPSVTLRSDLWLSVANVTPRYGVLHYHIVKLKTCPRGGVNLALLWI